MLLTCPSDRVLGRIWPCIGRAKFPTKYLLTRKRLRVDDVELTLMR